MFAEVAGCSQRTVTRTSRYIYWRCGETRNETVLLQRSNFNRFKLKQFAWRLFIYMYHSFKCSDDSSNSTFLVGCQNRNPKCVGKFPLVWLGYKSMWMKTKTKEIFGHTMEKEKKSESPTRANHILTAPDVWPRLVAKKSSPKTQKCLLYKLKWFDRRFVRVWYRF